MSDEPKAATMFHRAQADFEIEAQGRWAQQTQVQITGSTAPVVLPAPTWCAEGQLIGPEPGLGFEIDAVGQMLTTEHR